MRKNDATVTQLEAPKISIWTDARPEPGEARGTRRYAELLEEARLADTLLFHTFATTEQHGVEDGYLPAQLPLIAGLGVATERIRFMTNALLLPLHPWRQVVEQAIVADLLTGGRLALGVAAGGYAREFDLFGIDFHKRGELMERGLAFVRQGLHEGSLPDGPGGTDVEVSPRPVQDRVPVYLGGAAPKVIDRAVRLADGVLPVDFFAPESEFADLWDNRLAPALARHGKSLDNFRFTICVPMWVSEDPERDWNNFYERAVEYQFNQYANWAGDRAKVGVHTDSDTPWQRETMLVDTPENIVRRLNNIRARAPYHEVVFWYRIPHIGHERALAHLELVAHKIVPFLT
jgi:alkanesulfonate monooxygenase SsuD/methylene tetrahydromethanopterin reductase-like flavin-dependent oxidoreductase (luciferase family)